MSICIVHKDGWALTDSRGNMNGCTLPSKAKKAFKANGTIITSTGEAIALQKLEFLMQNKTMDEIPGAVSEFLYDNMQEVDSTTLMVNTKKQLLLLDGKGHIEEIEEQDYWAIGCAADRVLGYLDHCVVAGLTIDTSVAAGAIARAAMFDSGIDDRVQVFWLERG